MRIRNAIKRAAVVALLFCLSISGVWAGTEAASIKVKAEEKSVFYDSGTQKATAGGVYTYPLTLEKAIEVAIRVQDIAQMNVTFRVFSGDDTSAKPVFEETLPPYAWIMDYNTGIYFSQVNPWLPAGTYTVQLTFEQETLYILTFADEKEKDDGASGNTGSSSGSGTGSGAANEKSESEALEEMRSHAYEQSFANRCYDSITTFSKAKTGLKTLAWAYLAGTNDIVKPSWYQGYEVCNLYAVDPDTEIQGKKIDPKWLPQDNNLYLQVIEDVHLKNNPEVSHTIGSKPKGFQGTQREGIKFRVVAYDEEWVTVWEDGMQLWNVEVGKDNATRIACSYGMDAHLETHPAGFYKVRRKDVWIDFGLAENHPYKEGEKVPSVGTGVVTKLVYLRPVPNEKETTYTPVYALPKGTELNVVSAELVPSKASGSTHTYYQVSFNGSSKVQNNAVYYMAYTVPGLYYIDSRYMNFTKKGSKEQAGEVPGEISKSGTIYAYAAKDTKSEHIGILSKGVKLKMFPAESDKEWTTVLFSGKKCYVQTKSIKQGKYEVTNISKLQVADIIDDEYVVSWKPGKNNVDYSVEVSYRSNGKNKKEVLWRKEHVTDTTLTIDKKYKSNTRTICVTVQATTRNGDKGKALTLSLPTAVTAKGRLRTQYIKPKQNRIDFTSSAAKLYSMEYSTNKNFKNATLVENPVKKSGIVTGYNYVTSIKKLKPNTTYYVRYRCKKKVKTAAGEKWISGTWSDPVKIKTTK